MHYSNHTDNLNRAIAFEVNQNVNFQKSGNSTP